MQIGRQAKKNEATHVPFLSLLSLSREPLYLYDPRKSNHLKLILHPEKPINSELKTNRITEKTNRVEFFLENGSARQRVKFSLSLPSSSPRESHLNGRVSEKDPDFAIILPFSSRLFSPFASSLSHLFSLSIRLPAARGYR